VSGARAFPLAVAALLAATILLAACRFEQDYDKYAIVYGTSDYAGEALDLTYADDDAVALAALLAAQGYLGPDGLPAAARTDGAATKAQLIADIQDVAARATANDLLLLYYSGHGGQGPADLLVGAETAAGADAFEEWIFLGGSIVYVDNPPAGHSANDEYLADWEATVNDDQLAELLEPMPCRMKVVIVDACFSGGLIGNQLEHDAVPADYEGSTDGFLTGLVEAIGLYGSYEGYDSDIAPPNALVLAAAGEREPSYESDYEPYDGQGVFTYFLLQAPARADANGDGWVTVRETHRHVSRQIEAAWNRWYPEGTRFAPRVSGGPVDYVLFRAGP